MSAYAFAYLPFIVYPDRTAGALRLMNETPSSALSLACTGLVTRV